MKGNNKIELNYATVMEALQEYFDSRTLPKARFKITSIEAKSGNYDKAITVQTENVEPIEVPMTDQCEMQSVFYCSPDADVLMSSLREMVKAEAMLALFGAGAVTANAETKEQWGLQYSRHETVVREQLQKLVSEACSFKRESRF